MNDYHHRHHHDHCHYRHYHHHHGKWNLIGELMSIRLVQQLGVQIASQTLTNEPFHLVRTLRMFFYLGPNPSYAFRLGSNL